MNSKKESKQKLITAAEVFFQAKLFAGNVADFTAQKYGILPINTEKQFGSAITNSKTKKNAKLPI